MVMVMLRRLLVLTTIAAAIPTRPDDGQALVIQKTGLPATFSPDFVKDEMPSQQPIESLTVESWTAVQNALAGSGSLSAEEGAGNFVKKFMNRIQAAKARTYRKTSLISNLIANLKLGSSGSVGHYHHHGPMHWIPHEPIDLKHWTIGQILNWTLHHHDEEKALPLYKFAWLVNRTESVQNILLDEDANLTLFAEDNEALTPPHSRHHQASVSPDHESKMSADVEFGIGQSNNHPFWEAQEAMQKHSCSFPSCAGSFDASEDDDDEGKEKRRRMIEFIIKQVLRYHVSPGAKSVHNILDASTLGTSLPFSHEENSPHFRIRVSKPRPMPLKPITLNFFSELGVPILAKNGVIYILKKAPLLPPLSPLSEMFLFPHAFSTLTTGIQKVGLASELLPKHDGKTIPFGSADDEVDERVVSVLQDIATQEHEITRLTYTIFAPTNRAFKKLGSRLNAFLFSPFGGKVLRYVLKYHVIPDVVFYTDHIDKVNGTTDSIESIDTDVAWPSIYKLRPPRNFGVFGKYKLEDAGHLSHLGPEGHPHLPGRPHSGFPGEHDGPHEPHDPHEPPHGPGFPGRVNITHFTFPTLLGSRANETLSIDLITYRLGFGHGPISRSLVVKPPSIDGKSTPPIKVVIADGPAWGGAIHVIPDVIRPPHSHHDHHDDDEHDSEHGKIFGVLAKLWS